MSKELLCMNVTLNPTMLVVTPEYEYRDSQGNVVHKSRTSRKLESEKENFVKKRANNLISKKSRAKINKVVNWMAIAALPKKVYSKFTGRNHSWKLNFITLTIQSGWHKDSKLFTPACDRYDLKQVTPERMYDIDAVKFKDKLLNSFLSYARKYWKLDKYVWKIERTKDDTLHIHLTTDVFIPWRLLRAEWNRILLNNGLLNRYHEKFKNWNPNSIDIHAQKKHISNMAAYICKEMQKSDDLGRFIEGRLWGCSYNLSRAMNQKVTYFMNDDECVDLYRLERIVKDKKWIETKPDAISGKTLTVGEIYFPTIKEWTNNGLGAMKQKLLDTIYYLRNGDYGDSFFSENSFRNVVKKVRRWCKLFKFKGLKKAARNFYKSNGHSVCNYSPFNLIGAPIVEQGLLF